MKHNLFFHLKLIRPSANRLAKLFGSTLFVNFLSLGVAFPTFSAEPAVQDREVIEKAKGKKYRNGAEEGELQVQGQLHKPQRKIAPVIDRKETETSQDHD